MYRQWYERALRDGIANVRINLDSNITELILACDVEISCETCTTALESWIAGKPTVELEFGRHPLFFSRFHRVAERLV